MKEDWPILNGWTTIAFLAGEFPDYTFGNLVRSQSYRNPALLAKMAATHLGVTLVTVYLQDRRTLDLFAREVIPAVR